MSVWLSFLSVLQGLTDCWSLTSNDDDHCTHQRRSSYSKLQFRADRRSNTHNFDLLPRVIAWLIDIPVVPNFDLQVCTLSV